jgi:hypothetical protein
VPEVLGSFLGEVDKEKEKELIDKLKNKKDDGVI